jgi:hypothetical protein
VLYDQSIFVSAHLEFTANLDATNSNRLLFTASLRNTFLETIPVFVKLINGQYGEEVHHLLAQHNLAPMLHAYSKLESAPKAIVMKYLDPSSCMSLSAYSAPPNTRSKGPASTAVLPLKFLWAIGYNKPKELPPDRPTMPCGWTVRLLGDRAESQPAEYRKLTVARRK